VQQLVTCKKLQVPHADVHVQAWAQQQACPERHAPAVAGGKLRQLRGGVGLLGSGQRQRRAQADGAGHPAALLAGRALRVHLAHAAELVGQGAQDVERDPADRGQEEQRDGAEAAVAGGELGQLGRGLRVAGGQERARGSRQGQQLRSGLR
jgi:hypothetical protein